jgi:elongation factor P
MILASQLRQGTVLKIGEDLFRVIESTYHVGQGKMPGSVHAKVQHVQKGTFKEIRWRPEERLDEAVLEKKSMEFLFSDADSATFMDPASYEQVSIPIESIGPAQKFLTAEMTIPVEFFEGQPISVVFPPAAEVKVSTTAQPVHQQQDSTYKSATLENGLEVMVPQFIRPGEIVRIEVATGKYLDRVRNDIKRM